MLNYSLHRATTVVALDRFMAERIDDKGIAAEQDRRSLPPWSHDDVVRYDAEGRERFRQEHGLDGKYVVMYSGNHSPCHPLTTLLEAARRLRDRDRHRVLLRRRRQRVRDRAAVRRRARARQHRDRPVSAAGAAVGVALVRRSSRRRDGRPVRRHRPSVQGLQHPHARHSVPVHRTRARATSARLNPDFAAAHGDVDAVVRHIRLRRQPGVVPESDAPTLSAHSVRHSWSQEWCRSSKRAGASSRGADSAPSGV